MIKVPSEANINPRLQEQRRRQIVQILKQISKQYLENRSTKEEFNIQNNEGLQLLKNRIQIKNINVVFKEIEPYIRENDEACGAIVVRREQRDDEDECISKLKKDEVDQILEVIKIINPQLNENKLPLKKLSLKSSTQT